MTNERPAPSPPVTLLDACAVLSLFATRRMLEIVAVVPGTVAVADLVRAEALYVRRVVEGDIVIDAVDLGAMIAAGALAEVAAHEEAEFDAFVDLAIDLDQGEALSAALAIHRGYVLVTDDRKVERLLAGRVLLRPTLDLVKAWADVARVGDDELGSILQRVYERGYEPARHHPLKPWWDQYKAWS